MAVSDIVILIIGVIAMILGYRSGLVRQIGSFVAFLLAVIACRMGGDLALRIGSVLLHVQPDSGSAISCTTVSVVGYIVIFIVVWLAVWVVARLFHAVITAVKLGVLNAVLGALFMSLKILMVVSIVLNVWLVLDPGCRPVASGGFVTHWTVGLAPALMGVLEAA